MSSGKILEIILKVFYLLKKIFIKQNKKSFDEIIDSAEVDQKIKNEVDIINSESKEVRDALKRYDVADSDDGVSLLQHYGKITKN